MKIPHTPVLSRKPSAAKRKVEPAIDEPSLSAILALIHRKTGLDFARYKRGTVERRATRRMILRKFSEPAAYLRYLKKDPEEAAALAEDILIHVTEFFRDPGLFDILNKKVLPALLKKHPAGMPIRIWVPGCASGEEVYSIAILCLEFMRRRNLNVPLQIFGTDVSEPVLGRARQGRYDTRALASLSPDRLKRFFSPTEKPGTLQISKFVRDMCIFAKHNVVADTPFSQIDFISCRNVLIYLDESMRKKALPIFHYALRGGGHLVLGTSETTTGFEDLFEEIDKKHRVYKKKPRSTNLSLALRPLASGAHVLDKKQPLPSSLFDIEKEAAKILLAAYTPAWVVVNDDLTIQLFRGNTHPFLEPAAGKATFNLLKMARRELVSKLSEALSAARQSKGVIKRDHIPLRVSDRSENCRIEVIPIGHKVHAPHFLILFAIDEKSSSKRDPGAGGKRFISKEKDAQIAQIQEELINTTEYLQSLIEKQEAANEELRSANEEVTSTNEELQSMNEELETTQEELRSANEELIHINAELEARNDELRLANERLQKAKNTLQESEERMRLILESLEDYAIFMLDAKGNVATWNHAASKIKQYAPKEIIGKHFSRFYTKEDVKNGKPGRMLERAARTGRVEDKGWRVRKDGTRFWGDVIITAVRGDGGRLLGFVKATRDLTEMKRLEDAREAAHEALEARVLERTKALHETNEALQRENLKRKELETALRARAAFLSEADKQKDLFLATLSHELRNPLAPIVSAVELLKLQNAAPSAGGLIDVIEHHTKQLTHLLGDLLDVSRIMRGKVDLDPQRIDLRGTIEHAKVAIEPGLQKGGHTLSLSLPANAMYIMADPVRVEQILVNLLDNAAKYSKHGGRIALLLTKRKHDMRVSIKDNGIGIPQEKLEMIFDPFMQLDDAPEKRGGLGLGLMLARNLARLHGGDVVAKSEGKGKGSEFILTLPDRPRPQAEDEAD